MGAEVKNIEELRAARQDLEKKIRILDMDLKNNSEIARGIFAEIIRDELTTLSFDDDPNKEQIVGPEIAPGHEDNMHVKKYRIFEQVINSKKAEKDKATEEMARIDDAIRIWELQKAKIEPIAQGDGEHWVQQFSPEELEGMRIAGKKTADIGIQNLRDKIQGMDTQPTV